MLSVVDKDGFKDLIYNGNVFIPENSIVLKLSGEILPYPTRTSIQISETEHIEDSLGQYINHSCKPSCKVENGCIVSIKNINPGSSITFNYNETEVSMSSPFTCNCCGKRISGKDNR